MLQKLELGLFQLPCPLQVTLPHLPSPSHQPATRKGKMESQSVRTSVQTGRILLLCRVHPSWGRRCNPRCLKQPGFRPRSGAGNPTVGADPEFRDQSRRYRTWLRGNGGSARTGRDPGQRGSASSPGFSAPSGWGPALRSSRGTPHTFQGGALRRSARVAARDAAVLRTRGCES